MNKDLVKSICVLLSWLTGDSRLKDLGKFIDLHVSELQKRLIELPYHLQGGHQSSDNKTHRLLDITCLMQHILIKMFYRTEPAVIKFSRKQ